MAPKPALPRGTGAVDRKAVAAAAAAASGSAATGGSSINASQIGLAVAQSFLRPELLPVIVDFLPTLVATSSFRPVCREWHIAADGVIQGRLQCLRSSIFDFGPLPEWFTRRRWDSRGQNFDWTPDPRRLPSSADGGSVEVKLQVQLWTEGDASQWTYWLTLGSCTIRRYVINGKDGSIVDSRELHAFPGYDSAECDVVVTDADDGGQDPVVKFITPRVYFAKDEPLQQGLCFATFRRPPFTPKVLKLAPPQREAAVAPGAGLLHRPRLDRRTIATTDSILRVVVVVGRRALDKQLKSEFR